MTEKNLKKLCRSSIPIGSDAMSEIEPAEVYKYGKSKNVEKVTVKSGRQVKLYAPLGYSAHKTLYINDFRSYFFHF